MIGQKMTHYCKQYLTTRLFDFGADSELDIVVFKVGTFAKRVKMSCVILVVFKDPINRPWNSKGKDFA